MLGAYPENHVMRFWIVKGNPSRNNLDKMLVVGKVEDWVTRKPPRDWAVGDGVFFWKGAPALRLVGLGRIDALRGADANGETWFDLLYMTASIETPLGIEELRSDPVVGTASFLKAGAAGTVFPLTDAQAERLLRLVQRNSSTRGFARASFVSAASTLTHCPGACSWAPSRSWAAARSP